MRRSPVFARRSALSLVALLGAACSASGQSTSPRAAVVAPPAAPRTPPEVSGPARWLYTDRFGAIFDPSIPAPTLPGSEPAILDGVRVLVTNGILDGWARAEPRLLGFRRLPARFGGGYAIWSDARTYRADTFLGELTVLADVGASGGVRPWLGALLLRGSMGSVLVDPTTRALRRADFPGVADVIALDDRRGVRLDLLGRASFTADAGATWTCVLASRGALVSTLEEQEGGVALGTPGRPGPSLLVDRQGNLVETKAPPRTPASPFRLGASTPIDFPRSSRALPSEAIANAAALGARLPGDRLLVAREGGFQILAGATGLPIDDATLLDVDETLSRCQPFSLSSSPVLLACAGERGAEVLSLSGPLGRPRLEATFPERGGFVAGPHDRLGFTGRCGPLPPSPGDLGAATPLPGEMTDDMQAGLSSPKLASPELASRLSPSLPEDARYCARISADRWVERRLGGDDARSLYRFVPGNEGRITALVLMPKPDPKATPSPSPHGSSTGEGVRLIHLDPDDPALAGAAFPAAPLASTEAPYRSIDADYWEDDDGAIRGWVRLPAPGESLSSQALIPEGAAGRKLRVAPGRGGRSAGVSIDSVGHIHVLPLPEGVTEVVFGGRFGLAQAGKGSAATAWETVDGGRTWAVIQGPPIGALEPPPDVGAPVGCSAVGCTWGSGVVRLGWGGAPPTPDTPASPPETPASPAFREAPPVKIACSVDAESVSFTTALATKSALPISLRLGASALIGQLGSGGSFHGDVWSPFQPAAAVRHLAATDRSLTTAQGAVIPLLVASPREPVELLLAVGKRRLRAASSPPSFLPFDIPAKITVAVSGPDGELIALDPDKGIIWIARGEAVSAILRLGRVADVSRTRFTLGRRVESGAVVVVGYSIATGEVFAGDLDLARGEIGPLVALGRIETLTDSGAPACSSQPGAIRFVADLSIDLKLAGKGSAPLHAQRSLATFLIEASATRLCAAGVEVGFPQAKPADLTVRFGRGGGAAVRTTAQIFKGTCALESSPR